MKTDNVDMESISHWHYAPIKSEYGYGVHEVYFTNDDTAVSWTTNPVSLEAESLDDLREMLANIQRGISTKSYMEVDGVLVEEVRS